MNAVQTDKVVFQTAMLVVLQIEVWRTSVTTNILVTPLQGKLHSFDRLTRNSVISNHCLTLKKSTKKSSAWINTSPDLSQWFDSFPLLQQKHCILDITPNAVEQLNYHQLYPIVIFLNADNRSTVKGIRGQYLSSDENKGSRKLYQTAKKLKTTFAHIFTGLFLFVCLWRFCLYSCCFDL